MTGQLRQSPEERLEEYLQRCAEAHYEAKGEDAKLKDLGHQPGQVVIGGASLSGQSAVLAKMLAELKQEEAA